MLPLTRFHRLRRRPRIPRSARPPPGAPRPRHAAYAPGTWNMEVRKTMPRTKRLPYLALLTILTAGPVHAQIAGRPFEVSAGVGVTKFDVRDHIDPGVTGVGSIGWRWNTGLTFEWGWVGATTERDETYSNTPHSMSWTGLDVRWNLRDPSEKFTPFLLAGYGYGRSHDSDLNVISQQGTPSFGLGVVTNLFGFQRGALRLQVRDIMLKEASADQFSNHIAATAAFQWTFGGKAKDQDLHGVRNWIDESPNTPIGAKVDAKGAPVDSDRDSVFDGLDKCENTPVGARVDKDGCPMDADGDTVPDGIDVCDSTAKGAKVDAKGCPMDSDGDGVFDGVDQCENSPKGAVVDAKGCPMDADGDGVADGIDQCPNTPAGRRVGANGCPTEPTDKESQLLDAGVVRLQNLTFETNKPALKPESFPILDEVALVLLQFPTLQVEIGGHTDGSGNRAANMTLSTNRANAVLGYLTGKFPTLDASQFTVKGYGPTVPVASNSTALGRSKNRRIEFRVLNPDALGPERDKRAQAGQGEAPKN